MLVLSSLVALAIPAVLAQDPHNLTTLTGTWSSGARAVLTGPVGIIVGLDREMVFLITACGFAGLRRSRKHVILAPTGISQINRGW
jgi:hypothetical protein